ncbi:hypothetical protein Pth03_71560 [Planotetraspora thailandica]|uniref:Alpha/beta hydrolase n=1 Tax=Planotetraspora thailandica TaxID=487172 RepID=A0A8J3Y0Z8_9ACTN|nr:hypothetical protein [Planotetraspora thailandica]GII58767.1 hypothetical protein Pth03_71560 [Planotetraspora thailandica]
MPGQRAMIAALLLLTACGGTVSGTTARSPGTPAAAVTASPSPSPSPSLTGPNAGGCYTEADGRIFSYEDGGDHVGVIMGEGAAGVVVSYERGGSVCTWRPLADRLKAGGYRVLLYERSPAADIERLVVRMSDRLKKDGATRVFLIGGSVGGSRSIDAAARMDKPPAGVVNLAGFATADAVQPLRSPLLMITAENDPGPSPAGYQEADRAAVNSPDHSVIIAKGENAHASMLFETAQGPMVLDAIMAFLARHHA